MRRIKLKKCPLCGGCVSIYWGMTRKYCVQCPYCGLTTPGYYTVEEAVDEWNAKRGERDATRWSKVEIPPPITFDGDPKA